MTQEVQAQLGVLGLLFDCPYCKIRLFVPLKEINELEITSGEKEVNCDGCGKKIKIIFEKEVKNE